MWWVIDMTLLSFLVEVFPALFETARDGVLAFMAWICGALLLAAASITSVALAPSRRQSR